jgi:uncharacterized YkwD family protein/spore coat assembly protein SafA
VKKMMKKVFLSLAFLSCSLFFLSTSYGNEAYAQASDQYRVKSGDSMWKIALKYQIGVSEIIGANKQISNPNMIYPNQVLTIPNIDDVKGVESQVLSLVNAERSKAGLPPLQMDWELARVARYKSDDMQAKGYFSHQSPTYGSPFDMMKQFGISYRTAGENIAKGQRSPQEAMTSWMNSSGHRANILKREYTHIGVGYNPTGHVWTQMFIGK